MTRLEGIRMRKDLVWLREAVDSYVEGMLNGRISEDAQPDYERAIFEAAVEAFYDVSIWKEFKYE